MSFGGDHVELVVVCEFLEPKAKRKRPPGAPLNAALLKALHLSKALVVILNRGTLEEPKWRERRSSSSEAVTQAGQ